MGLMVGGGGSPVLNVALRQVGQVGGGGPGGLQGPSRHPPAPLIGLCLWVAMGTSPVVFVSGV